MMIQNEAFTLDMTRFEIELMLKALSQYMPVIDNMKVEDYEIMKRIEEKLKEAVRLI